MPEDVKDTGSAGATDSQSGAVEERDILGFGSSGSTDSGDTADGQDSEGGEGLTGKGGSGDGSAEDGKGSSTARGEGEGRDAARGSGEQARDERGRFAAKPEAGQAGGAGAGAQAFRFLDEDFGSQAEAEQKWRSYFGSVKAWQDRHDTLKKQYDELAAKLQKQGQPAPSGEPGPATAGAEKAAAEAKKELGELSDLVDYELYKEIFDDPGLGPARAQMYVLMKVGEYLKNLKAEVTRPAELDPRLESVFKSQEEQEIFDETTGLIENMAKRKDGAGGQLYPRLKTDRPFCERVLQIYFQDADLRSRGEYGLHLAYLDAENWERYVARDIKNHKPAAAGASGGNGAPPPAPSQGPPRAPTPPTDHVLSGSDSPAVMQERKRQDWVDRHLDELEKYGAQKGDGVLGF